MTLFIYLNGMNKMKYQTIMEHKFMGHSIQVGFKFVFLTGRTSFFNIHVILKDIEHSQKIVLHRMYRFLLYMGV